MASILQVVVIEDERSHAVNRTGSPTVHRKTLASSTEHGQGRSFVEVGRLRLSGRVVPMALAWVFVVMACQQTAATPDGPSARQLLPGLAAPRDDNAQRTPAQKKISSQLLAEMAARADADGAVLRRAGVDVDADGRVLVDIDATVTDALLGAIEMTKGIVVNNFPQYDAVRARVPLDQVESLAERTDVRFIRQADLATTNSPGIVPQGH